jgi:hypothetical protein
MAGPVRMMLEQGKKKRVVACAFDWPGWDRSARIDHDVLAVFAAYRPRYAKVAELAAFRAEFAATGELEVVERAAADCAAPAENLRCVSQTRRSSQCLSTDQPSRRRPFPAVPSLSTVPPAAT